jgi:hypothetical protein
MIRVVDVHPEISMSDIDFTIISHPHQLTEYKLAGGHNK